MPLIYLLILIVPLLIYAVLSATIIFHLKKYGIAGDLTQEIVVAFFIVSVALILLAAWSFFIVPWNDIDLAAMMQNMQNSNPIFFRQ